MLWIFSLVRHSCLLLCCNVAQNCRRCLPCGSTLSLCAIWKWLQCSLPHSPKHTAPWPSCSPSQFCAERGRGSAFLANLGSEVTLPLGMQSPLTGPRRLPPACSCQLLVGSNSRISSGEQRERGEVSFSMSDSSTEAAQLVKWDFIPHLQSPVWSVSAGRRAANQSPKQGVLGTGKHTLWFPLSQELSHWCGALSLPLGVVLHGGLDGWEPWSSLGSRHYCAITGLLASASECLWELPGHGKPRAEVPWAEFSPAIAAPLQWRLAADTRVWGKGKCPCERSLSSVMPSKSPQITALTGVCHHEGRGALLQFIYQQSAIEVRGAQTLPFTLSTQCQVPQGFQTMSDGPT